MSELAEFARKMREHEERLLRVEAKLNQSSQMDLAGIKREPGLNTLGQDTEVQGNLAVTGGNITLDDLATVDGLDISGMPGIFKLDDLGLPDDNTDLDASITRHGLLRKLDNDADHFLDGQGNWMPAPNIQYLFPPITGWMLSGTVVTVRNNQAELDFRDANSDSIITTMYMPPPWNGKSMKVDLIWRGSTSTAGNVMWVAGCYYQTYGELEQAAANIDGSVITAGGQAWRKSTVTIGTLAPSNISTAMGMRIYRSGSNVSDTYVGVAYLGGVIYYVS